MSGHRSRHRFWGPRVASAANLLLLVMFSLGLAALAEVTLRVEGMT